MRRCVALGAALIMSATAAASANAADFTFTTSGGNDTTVSSKTFTSNTVGGTTVKMQVTAWHWNDPGNQKIVSASLGLWSPGLGVLTSSESGNQHQIDNISGVDFIMLQFDHVVSLSNIGRAVFDLGFNPDDSDAAYWADTNKLVGTAATWSSSINLASPSFSFNSSLWTPIEGDGSNGKTGISGAPSAAVWLLGANPSGSDRDDGFKLSSLVVSAAVPEPATWGMMVIGFGLVGGAIRRRPAQLGCASRI